MLGCEGLRTDYARFVERWPRRKYALKPGSLKVSCFIDKSQCVVDALLDWEVENSERNARSTGVTSWHVLLSRDSSDFAIASIDGKVLERHMHKLNPDLRFCLGPFCFGQSGNNESGANER
jgi:hypothetical protein